MLRFDVNRALELARPKQMALTEALNLGTSLGFAHQHDLSYGQIRAKYFHDAYLPYTLQASPLNDLARVKTLHVFTSG